MSKEGSNSLIDLSGVSEAAVALIEKVSEGVGGLVAPWQIKRVAEAEAEAEIKKVQSEIKITDLHRRSVQRRVKEDMRDQRNMEDIIAQAVPDVNKEAKPGDMENDWVANFFDKCRIVSDGEMQSLWSRVLAGEANAPGTYSKRTVNLLSDLDKSDAELFTKLCGFGWAIEDLVPLMFDFEAEIYTSRGIIFDTISHLENIGLVRFNSIGPLRYSGIIGFERRNLPQRLVVHYYGKPLVLEMPGNVNNTLEIGTTQLTKIGQELAPICGSKPVDGFYEYVKNHWKQYLPKVENSEQKE